MAQIVVAGHICLDIIPKFLGDAHLEPGRLIEVGEAELSTGGCVANVGLALNKLGVRVKLLGKLGDDPFGSIVVSLLNKAEPGMGESFVMRRGGVTSYSVVINPPNKDRTFLHMPGENNSFNAADVLPEALTGAEHFHFGYPPLMAKIFENEGTELEAIFRIAKAAGLSTSLDMSLPDPNSPSGRANWKLILKRVLPYVDFFFPSESEIEFMFGHSGNPEEYCVECLELGAGVVVIKCGERGIVAKTASHSRLLEVKTIDPTEWAERSESHGCFAVDVVGTTGAGDATISGFLRALLDGSRLTECLQAGCAVGACSVEAVDALTGIRTWEETQQRVANGWKTR